MLAVVRLFLCWAVIVACGSTQAQTPAAGDKAAASCRGMKDLSSVPAGFHPTTAKWAPDSPFGDTVCIAKTSGKEIRVLAWYGFPLPSGYHVVSSVSSGVDTTFRGCAQFTTWQGVKNCATSWSFFVMRKNGTR